ncbi:MAG: hypothetical protein QXF43_01310 [Nitrososphaerales archaeon]
MIEKSTKSLEKEIKNVSLQTDNLLNIKESYISSPSEKFENCKNIGDVFELVKETTERALGLRRAGLTLYLIDLPIYIGGLHEIGSNAIVMNKTLLKAIERIAKSRREANSFIYHILLHEYLHALGYFEEKTVRKLVYTISINSFGEDHDVTKLAEKGYSYIMEQVSKVPIERDMKVEIVKDFDRSSMSYIG